MTKRKNFSEGARIWHCEEDTPMTASPIVNDYDNRPIDIHGNTLEHSTSIGALYARGELANRDYENKHIERQTPSGDHKEKL